MLKKTSPRLQAKGKAEPSLPDVVGLCHCPCHQAPDAVVHPVPCCTPCQHCGEDISVVPKRITRKLAEASLTKKRNPNLRLETDLRTPTTVISPNFFSGIASDQVVPHQPTLDAVEISQKALGSEPIRGENPDVLKYRLRYDPDEEIYAFAAIFYDCFEVYSFSSKELADRAV